MVDFISPIYIYNFSYDSYNVSRSLSLKKKLVHTFDNHIFPFFTLSSLFITLISSDVVSSLWWYGATGRRKGRERRK